MKKWAMVLHLYQPPTIETRVVKSVYETCYLPLVKLLAQKKDIGITLNISGSLILALKELQAEEFFKIVTALQKSGKVELLNSPLYHPIMPITPWSVVERQIRRNSEVARDVLNIDLGKGFFPPELAVDSDILAKVSKFSDYAIVDEKAVSIEGPANFNGLGLIPINHKISNEMKLDKKRVEAGEISKLIAKNVPSDSDLVTANDAEIFGHHYEERLDLLDELLSSRDFNFVKTSDLFKNFSKWEKINSVTASTWQEVEDYKLWNGNKLQKKYIAFANFAYKLWGKYEGKLEGLVRHSAAWHLDLGWTSCHMYWLSNKPWWNPELVERGAHNLIKCIRTLPAPRVDKFKAETMYSDLIKDIWLHHWSGKVEKGYRRFDRNN